MLILSIETSCDETALALISMNENSNGEVSYTILDSIVHSQAEMHAEYGGVFPTMAKREHINNFPILLSQIIKNLQSVKNDTLISKLEKDLDDQNSFNIEPAGKQSQEKEMYENLVKSLAGKFKINIDRIAVTSGPGLEPALWVGIMYAEALGKMWNVPVYPINHMEGHILASLMGNIEKNKETKLIEPNLPALALLISGGHTEMVLVTKNTHPAKTNKFSNEKYKYEVIGHTIDDALGEAYDKVARMMGLPYPGGPHIAKLAQLKRENLGSKNENVADQNKISLPRPLLLNHNVKDANYLNFSFSGLKTAVLYALREHAPNQIAKETTITSTKDKIKSHSKEDANKEDITSINTKSNLKKKKKSLAMNISYEFENAITDVLKEKVKRAIEQKSANSLIIGGGVIANKYIRQEMQKLADEQNILLFLPDNSLTGDNAIMIACASYFIKQNETKDFIYDNHHEKIIANGNMILGQL